MTDSARLAARLAALHAGAVAGSEARGWSAAEFAGLLAGPGVILTGGSEAFLLGRVTLDEAEVLMLATDPARRRQGHARRALAAFEQRAAFAGAGAVFLDVAEDNQAALLLYKATGYEETGRRPRYFARRSGAAVAAILMRKALCPSG